MSEFDTIKNSGRLLYEYIRGSHLYGLNNDTSDIDTSGVFICTADELLGNLGYKPQVSDARHDNTWYEVGELIRLLLKSNPTVLESLFIPKDKIIGKVHPLMQLFIENRDCFITKECFNPFYGYAKSQIEQARGLNKKMVNPVLKKLAPYDFIYVIQAHGSMKVCDWLSKRGLYQEYCGLAKISNMNNIYALYYDFGTHVFNNPSWIKDKLFLSFAKEYYKDTDSSNTIERLSNLKPIGYRGIVRTEDMDVELRLSSIDDKHLLPICFISYNQDGYSMHCRQYADYQTWIKNRNPKRYESNLNKNYDAKNMMHCFRLIHMAGEIAEGKSMQLKRTWDKQFLMDVRNHKFEYEEIIELLEKEKEHMNKLMEESTITEKIDVNFVNQLLIEIRRIQLGFK